MMVPIHALQWYRFADTVTILFARGIESFGNTKFLAEIFATCTVEITQYALKGQKLLAQSIALGNYGYKLVAL